MNTRTINGHRNSLAWNLALPGSTHRPSFNRIVTLMAVLVTQLFAILLVWPFGAAGAQVGSLELVHQTPFVAADGELETELRWTGASMEDLTLSAIVWAPISEEPGIYLEPSEVRNQISADINSIPRTPNGNLQFTIPIRSFQADDERIWLQESGVYPVTIEVRNDSGVLARLRTNLIRLPTDIAEIPLFPISPVISVSSADGLGLNEAIQLLEAHPTLPLTVLLEDGLLAQLQSDPVLTATFAAALGDRTIVAGTQQNLDPSALAEIGQPEFYHQALAETRQSYSDLGLHLDRQIIPLETGITEAGVELLTTSGFSIVIDLHTSIGSRGSISSDSGSLTVVRIDDEDNTGLIIGSSLSQGSSGVVQRAHRLLALLAVRYQTDRSPVILGGGGIRTLDLQAFEIILEALDRGGMMEAISIDRASLNSRTLPFRPQENPDQNLGTIAEPLSAVQELLDVYSGFRVAGGPSPEGIQLRLLEGVSRDLNPTARANAIEAVAADLNDEFAVISLPEGPAITLAARTTAIPLTITNNSSGVRKIRIRFESDRIRVAEHDQEILVEPGVSQLDINIEAQSLGVSSLLVTVLTPDGSRQLATTRFEIRSTAIPGLGYALTGTALVFLVIWWFRSISRSRALKKHPANASEDDRPERGSTESTGLSVDPATNPSVEPTSDKDKADTTLSS